MLAAHVVGGGQHLAERRAAQHPGVPGGVGDPVGEVGVAAGDELEAQRRRDLGAWSSNHAVTRGDVDALGRVASGLARRRRFTSGRRGVVPSERPRARDAARARSVGGAPWPRGAPVAVAWPMTIDVTDATFETDVLDRSDDRPRSSSTCGRRGAARAARSGRSSRRSSTRPTARSSWPRSTSTRTRRCPQAFQVQGIPAVYAVDGRQGGRRLRRRPARGRRSASSSTALLPSEAEEQLAALLAAGDEASLRQALELEPDHDDAIVALAELLVAGATTATPTRRWRCSGASPRRPRPAGSRRWPAPVRTADAATSATTSTAKLDALLDQVKDDDDARQEFLDLLELLGPDDPRTADYRKRLTRQLF